MIDSMTLFFTTNFVLYALVAGISLALFSGQEKIVKGKTRLRGDINTLPCLA